MAEKKKQWEEDPEVAARVNAIKKAAEGMQRGQVLLWEVIEAAVGLDRKHKDMRYAISKWRKFVVRELGIETWFVPGVGVKMLMPNEHFTVVADKRGKMAYRQHGKILRAMTKTLDTSKLSEHELRMRAAIIDHSRSARKQTNKVTSTARGNVQNNRQSLIERAKLMGGQQP
jgi:hypothetical protein